MSLSSYRSQSSNSYRLSSSTSSSAISITTVSSQFENERRNDNDQIEENHMNWQIEKNIYLKDQRSNKTTCILKATMINEQILISDSSTIQSTIIPGKHVSMKVVFKY